MKSGKNRLYNSIPFEIIFSYIIKVEIFCEYDKPSIALHK